MIRATRNTDEPQRPDRARELIAHATKEVAHLGKRVRDQLDAVRLGQGRHTNNANTKVLRRILAEHG